MAVTGIYFPHRKAIALGQKVEAEARKIGREYGKSKATILAEAGLSVKAY